MRFLYLSIVYFILSSQVLLANTTDLRVFAASSLTNVLEDIAREFKSERKIVFNFGASSKLAHQIFSGAPADIYFSADNEWMDFLVNKDLIEKSSKQSLLSNKIVLIVPHDATEKLASINDLQKSLYHHIALANETVPAGKYARIALTEMGVLDSDFRKKIVNAENVRIALTWVAKHEAAAGIVYATDAIIEPKVKVAFIFPEISYPKIVYPVAIIKKSDLKNEAEKFLAFCKSKKAKVIFMKAGFITLEH